MLKHISILKTIYFNFKMLPFSQAKILPIFIAKHSKFISLKGAITIDCALETGMIKFGFSDVGIVDKKYNRTLIEINGKIVFKGSAIFGNGSKISVGKNGILQIGNKFCISANSTIICFDSVVFGDNVLFSWEVLVMDTDFHETVNTINNEIKDKITSPINIGNNVWIGMRSTLLKGTTLPDNIIIGANSLLNKPYQVPNNVLLAGNPAILKKTNIRKQ